MPLYGTLFLFRTSFADCYAFPFVSLGCDVRTCKPVLCVRTARTVPRDANFDAPCGGLDSFSSLGPFFSLETMYFELLLGSLSIDVSFNLQDGRTLLKGHPQGKFCFISDTLPPLSPSHSLSLSVTRFEKKGIISAQQDNQNIQAKVRYQVQFSNSHTAGSDCLRIKKNAELFVWCWTAFWWTTYNTCSRLGQLPPEWSNYKSFVDSKQHFRCIKLGHTQKKKVDNVLVSLQLALN